MLSKEDAQKFLETQEEKNRKDADLITKNNNLTELELLEEEVLGLFTVPQDVHRRVIKKIESRASNS
jgi:DNA repair photolyase